LAGFCIQDKRSNLAFVLSGIAPALPVYEPGNSKREKKVVVAQKIKRGHAESFSKVEGARNREAQSVNGNAEGGRNGGFVGNVVVEESKRGVPVFRSVGGCAGDVIGNDVGERVRGRFRALRAGLRESRGWGKESAWGKKRDADKHEDDPRAIPQSSLSPLHSHQNLFSPIRSVFSPIGRWFDIRARQDPVRD
jgi:hypothetical protein